MKRQCVIILVVLLACSGWAQGSAFDSASDAVYDDGWDNGDNGGAGFGNWIFGGDAAGHLTLAPSISNGGAGSIDTGGRSFGLTDADNSGQYIDVFRFLNTDLQIGQTLSLDMDVNWRAGYKGIRIRGADDNTAIFRFEVGNGGAGDDYIVYDAASGNGSIGNAYSDDTQFHISLTQSSAGGGIWSITRSGGISDLDTGTYSGTASSFQLYTLNAGTDAQQAVYFNNFEVASVPEPSSAGLLLLALGLLARRVSSKL